MTIWVFPHKPVPMQNHLKINFFLKYNLLFACLFTQENLITIWPSMDELLLNKIKNKFKIKNTLESLIYMLKKVYYWISFLIS